jgi:uncharacterized protein (DUF885 family)
MHHANRAARPLAWGFLLGAMLMASAASAAGSYDDLLVLFRDWQRLEQPALRDGAPDYTVAAIASRQAALGKVQARLAAIDPNAWPVEQKIDYELVRSQLHALEFDIRWLRPWERDPAFYQSVRTEQSDTPQHEGPVNHALVELWQYSLPLSNADAAKLAGQLRTIPPLLAQARINLTGNAHDLWITGTGTMQQQAADLEDLSTKTAGSSADLAKAIDSAASSTKEFVAWLQAQAPSKTGPSGVARTHTTGACATCTSCRCPGMTR